MLLLTWALWIAAAVAGPCETLAELVTVSHQSRALRPAASAPAPAIPASPEVAALPALGPDLPLPTPMVGLGDGVALVHEGRVLLVQGGGVVGAIALEGVETLVALGPDRLLALGHAPGAAPPMDAAILLDTSDPHRPTVLEALELRGRIGLAGAVGDEVWLVATTSTGLSAVHRPTRHMWDPPPSWNPPLPLDRQATLLQAQLTLAQGLLPARVNGQAQRLVRCEALGLVGDPEGLTALVRLPRDGGSPRVDAVLGAAQVMAGGAAGVAVGVGDQIVRWTPDGNRRVGAVPGSVMAVAPAGDGAIAAWIRVPLDDEGPGVQIRPPQSGPWGLSALLPRGEALIEGQRTPLGELGVHPTWVALNGHEALLVWPDRQLTAPIGPGEVQVVAAGLPGGGGRNARGEPVSAVWSMGPLPEVRTRVSGPVRQLDNGVITERSDGPTVAAALPGEPAGASALAAERPALLEAHARLLGDDGAWYTARQTPRWIGAWPVGDGLWVASAGGLTRMDAQGREIQTVPLVKPTLSPAPSGWTFAPADWSLTRLARFGVGDAGDVATCVDGDDVWVAADGALRRLKGSRFRNISSFEGFLRGLACGGGQVLVATRSGGAERILHLSEGRLTPVEGLDALPEGTVAALVPGPDAPWVALNGAEAGVWALEGGRLVSRWAPPTGAPFEARGLAVGTGGDFALSWAGAAGQGGVLWRQGGALRTLAAPSSAAPWPQGGVITQVDDLALAAGRLWFFAQVQAPGGTRVRALLAADERGELRLVAAPGQALAAGGAAVVALGGLSAGPGDRLVLDAIFEDGPGTLLLGGDALAPVIGPPAARPSGAPAGAVWADGPAAITPDGQVLLWAAAPDGHLSLWSATPEATP